MTKARINPSNWGYNEEYTHDQLNASDAYWPDLIDGAGGGTWAPSSVITIGGSGLTVTGAFTSTGSFSATSGNFVGNVNILGILDVGVGSLVVSSASVDINVGTTINAGLVVNGVFGVLAGNMAGLLGDVTAGSTSADTFAVFATTTFHSPVTVVAGQAVTIGGALAATSTLAVTGNATFAGDVHLRGTDFIVDSGGVSVAVQVGFVGAISILSSANVSLASIITPSGVGRVRKRTVTAADADATYGADDAEEVLIPPLGAQRTITLSDTNAALGDRIRFNALANTTPNSFAVQYGARSWFLRNQAAQIIDIEFIHNGSAWRTNGGTVADALWDG